MALSFDQVSFRYRDGSHVNYPALDGLTFDLLTQGRLVAVLGAPGSGKSTLLQHMNGLLVPDEGYVRIMEYEIKPNTKKIPSNLRKKVGLVFQYPEQQLFADTVKQDMSFGPINFGAGKVETEEAVWRAASAMRLDVALLEQSPFQLSSGQMRKAAIAAVLAADPDIVVLDEPTASLDPASRDELMQLLRSICLEQGRAVVIVTHRLEEVLSFADEFVVLDHGKVIFQGDAAALIQRPEVLDTAGLVLPPSIQLARELGKQLGADPPQSLLSADQLADWIIRSFDGRNPG